MKRFSVAVMAALTMALAVVSSGAAQPNQNGLVNVAVVDNTVQIPIGVAANVCGVAVNILATATAVAPVDCDATALSGAMVTGPAAGGGGGGNQRGLVNLYVADNTVQVPIAIAANICGVSANVLASGTLVGPASCEALGNAEAGA
jgi:hypothetical protein